MKKSGLKMFIKRNILKRAVTSEDVIERLRRGGAKIGTDVMIYSTSKTMIDAQVPYLLEIGNHVRIAEGVKILTHDYAWAVLKRYESQQACAGAVFGAQSPVVIGDNVFIGMNAIITRGVTVGNNVIIGAGSVVTRDCLPNSVYAGNPARRIMSLEEFRAKRESLQFEEAREIAIRYRERFGHIPPREIFNEYFMLFSTGEEAQKVPAFRAQMERMGNFEDTVRYMQHTPPQFANYEDFLKVCYEAAAPATDKEKP